MDDIKPNTQVSDELSAGVGAVDATTSASAWKTIAESDDPSAVIRDKLKDMGYDEIAGERA